MKGKKYLDYLFNPLDILRTKEVLQVNPTVIHERKEAIKTSIYIHEYDNNNLLSKEIQDIKDCYKHVNTPEVTWINIDGIKKTDVENLAEHFSVHQLIVEDILSLGQRPKMDQINGLLFCVLNMLYFNEKEATVESEQISIVLGKNFVISFQEDESRDVFNTLREKIKINGSKIRQNKADFLYYAMIDAIVDHYYLVMEKLGERIEQLEEDIIKYSSNKTLVKINNLRKEMILLKRSIGPVRELIHGILRSENELIEDRTEKYFKDVYDHIVQANDLAESYRDMMINLQDLYLSNVNLKMNEVMKVMAVVTCLLAPATVIGGIFGMNFDKLPYIHHEYGFYIAAALMLAVPVIMVFIFRKRGWF